MDYLNCPPWFALGVYQFLSDLLAPLLIITSWKNR